MSAKLESSGGSLTCISSSCGSSSSPAIDLRSGVDLGAVNRLLNTRSLRRFAMSESESIRVIRSVESYTIKFIVDVPLRLEMLRVYDVVCSSSQKLLDTTADVRETEKGADAKARAALRADRFWHYLERIYCQTP
jgi:hypothetical protein